MPAKDFTTSFTVNKSAIETYKAVNDVRSWWSGQVDGVTDKLGAEFSYRYGDVHHSVQKISELEPGKRVVWKVTDASLKFPKKDEWKGTEIVFEISEKDGKTELRFTHKGLVPQFECYEDCSGAWGVLVGTNLRKFLGTGVVQPDPFV